jgi:23S rRNA (guanosine2251-2'-O)-methyltransferase
MDNNEHRPDQSGRSGPGRRNNSDRGKSPAGDREERPRRSYEGRPAGDQERRPARSSDSRPAGGYRGRPASGGERAGQGSDRRPSDRPASGRPTSGRTYTSRSGEGRPAGEYRPARPARPAGEYRPARPARPGYGERSEGDHRERPDRPNRPSSANRRSEPGAGQPREGGRRYGRPEERPTERRYTSRPPRGGSDDSRASAPPRPRRSYGDEQQPRERFRPSGPRYANNPASPAAPITPAAATAIVPPAGAAAATAIPGAASPVAAPFIALEPGAGLPDRLEGRNPILEAIKAGRTINKLWVAKREERPDPALGRLIALAREAGAVIMEVDRKALDAMSMTHGHQGVIAQVAAHEYIELDDLISQSKAGSATPFLLILAELQDSYNLGSILRIADAAGVNGIIIPMRRSVGLDAAVAKASAGAIEHVPVARVGNLVQTIIALKKEGFWIAGTDADGKTNYKAADWQGPLAILIGSEGEGLSPSLKRQCDFQVVIPMQGKVNSLNAAVAAGIVTFEAAAQRAGKSGAAAKERPPIVETADAETDEANDSGTLAGDSDDYVGVDE